MLNTKLSTNAQPLKPAIEQALLSLHAQQKQQQMPTKTPIKWNADTRSNHERDCLDAHTAIFKAIAYMDC